MNPAGRQLPGAGASPARVRVGAAAAVPYDLVVHTMDTAREAGFANVTLVVGVE